MRHKIQKAELFIGVIIFSGGLLTYGSGLHRLLPVPRPDELSCIFFDNRELLLSGKLHGL